MIDEILRFADEPCRYWNDRQVHQILTKVPAHFIKEMYQEYIAHSNQDVPEKQIFDNQKHRGDFRIMPCVVDDLKIVKIVGTNHAQIDIKDKITVGKALVLHPTDNYVTDIIDACALSSARTGAVIAIASILSERSRKTTTIVGAGRIGYYAALYLCSIGEVEKMYICDTYFHRATNIVNDLSIKFPHIKFEATRTFAGAANLIVTATDSQWPMLHPEMTNASTIISAGADEVNQRELHVDWIYEANIYVDSMDSMRYGDLNVWKRSLTSFKCKPMCSLITNPGRYHARNVFITTGSALFDNLAIKYLLKC